MGGEVKPNFLKMKISFKKIAILGSLLMFGAVGCFKDLDTEPIDTDVVTAAAVYKNPAAYKQVLAKLYAGFSVSGQQGPAGQADIAGIDEGFGQYLRGFWYHQELPTDEAVIGWNDQTIKDFHNQTWTSSDGFIFAFYSRVFYQIALANEYLRETNDAKLSERGVDATLKAEITKYRAEARFLRALSYWHGLDLFRKTPFATENDVLGTFLPKQTTAADLFAFIESELKAIESDLAAPRSNEYGRADKAAAWMLLAKLYLNAEVYIGQRKYNECLQECEKILGAGFELEPTYANLFLADNHKSKEIIFPVTFDGIATRTWGGMTFIIRAGIGGTMNPTTSGVVSGWGGTRVTGEFIDKFPVDLTGIIYDFKPGLNRPEIYMPTNAENFDPTNPKTRVLSSLPGTSNNKIYETHRFLTAGTELVFAQFPDPNGPKLGDNGADLKLETGGANIKINETGFYFIRVNLNNKTYVIEKREWAILGSATGGAELTMQWDSDLQMPFYSGALGVGSFKFRANKDDAKSLGDNTADGILEYAGAEINIAKSGTFKVYLDIDKPDYSFQVKSTSFDRRGMFYTTGQNKEISTLSLFTDGYACNKFKNITSDGKQGKDTDFPDTDFPMFRLGDVYLMAAEAVLRSGGDNKKATDFVNKVRERAYTGSAGNFDSVNLDLILDERARELYWECHRRTDLVRFGQLTDGSYRWAWKGGTQAGASVGSFRNVFPIPAQDLGANPNLKQNDGY